MTIELRQNLKAIMGSHEGTWTDLPSLVPANTLLELAGETLRPRLYFTTSPNGQEFCLRADLTIPAALYYLDNFQNGAEYTLLCEGNVFRAPNIDGARAEFTQIGIEKFGNRDIVPSDIEIFKAALLSCKGVGLREPLLSFSDGSLIDAILKGPKLSPSWFSYLRARSKSKTALQNGIGAALRHEKSQLTPLEAKLIDQDEAKSESIVFDLLQEKRLQTGPARNILDIASRIKSKAFLKTSPPLDVDYAQTFLAILEINDEPISAINKTIDLAKNLSVDLTQWGEEWRQRFSLMAGAIDSSSTTMRFYAMSDARFEYYDGMIFEIASVQSPELPIAFGGRYDGLINALSNGAQNVKAVGAVIRPERLEGLGKNV